MRKRVVGLKSIPKLYDFAETLLLRLGVTLVSKLLLECSDEGLPTVSLRPDDVREVTERQEEFLKCGALNLEFFDKRVLLVKRHRVSNEFNFGHFFTSSNFGFLSGLENFLFFTQLWALKHVGRIFAPFARDDGQLREHHLAEHGLFARLEAKTHHLEGEAGKHSPGNCVHQL